MNYKGLTSQEVKNLQQKYGKNEIVSNESHSTIKMIFHILKEPMFLLLFVTAAIYFLLSNPQDGILMLVFVTAIILIEILQEYKVDKTLEKLKELAVPKIIVLRDKIKKEILSSELVPGDIMYIHEGDKIPADGKILEESGLVVDESTLTGESVTIWKTITDETNNYFKSNFCYAGTLVVKGTGIIEVTSIGNNTEYGKIGATISKIKSAPTMLQIQMRKLIKLFAIIALSLCLIIMIITFIDLNTYSLKARIIESILSGVTIAMALIPEEFPVVLTLFLSMGAWRIAKKKSLVKNLASVETLGSVSVLCVDKTGTITKNQMKVNNIWTYNVTNEELLSTAALCCEKDTFDPMEKAILKYCNNQNISTEKLFANQKIKSYPFSNKLKVLGMIWNINNQKFLAAKGSVESILKLTSLSDKVKSDILAKSEAMASEGLRVIAVGQAKKMKIIPDHMRESKLVFLGLIGLVDPPRDNIKTDIKECYKAGIKVVMITGDNGTTASSIAKEIGMHNTENVITGEMLDSMTDDELQQKIMEVSIFSRVVPNHKLRIIEAFKNNKEIVAMTGDGVNDAPALKAADIGIAMGNKGTEVSREAADIVLLDDNFKTIVDTIEDGRRIYDNIKKAIGYIIAIHIPIALSSLCALLLKIDINYLLLLPIHIALFEIVTDPTCSIILERQPAEENIMDRPPRKVNEKLINFKEVMFSISQGITLFIVTFLTYYYFVSKGQYLIGRTMGITMILVGNIFLVMICSSKYNSALTVMKKFIKDKVYWAITGAIILSLILIIYTPLNQTFKLTSLPISYFGLAIFLAFISTYIFDIIKVSQKKSQL